ncbi:MAG: hypothetical protein ACRD93_05010 [Nitrososphaeraceae archaeon]
MSLCYEFQKWTMITFVIVASVLVIGLIMLVGHEVKGLVSDNGTCYTENPTMIYDDHLSTGAQKIFRDMIEGLPDDLAEKACQNYIDQNIGVPP